ncbi:MAG: hypothetical protein V1793_25760 [Pseudomonadota bacterium]
MNYLKIVLLVIALAGCGHAAPDSRTPLTTGSGTSPRVLPPDKPVLQDAAGVQPLSGHLITGVATSGESFNPSLGETVFLSYTLLRPARVKVCVIDPDLGLIRTLLQDVLQESGERAIAWDGVDMDGAVVPDEAYFFTIEATDDRGTKETYDPTTFSGGVEHDITSARIDPEQYTIGYAMPETGRVMIRMGIQGGPLLNQAVDWKPRIRGAVTEYWNGMDADSLIPLYRHPGFKLIITYFTLPETSMVTFGNRSTDFRHYKALVAAARPVKPERESSVADRAHHYLLSRTRDYCPGLNLTVLNPAGTGPGGRPVLHGKALVRVSLHDEDMAVFQNQPFEICFFLDGVFYAEDESGYTPFNWVWDLTGVNPGEHVLTVNVSGFRDQIGIRSIKVDVAP